MKRTIFVLAMFALLTVSCQKEQIEEFKNQEGLTIEQKELKSNLDKAANLISQIINSTEVKKEFSKVFNSNIDYNSYIKFDELLNDNIKETATPLPKFSEKVKELFSTKDNSRLSDYLVKNGCSIYIPYPFDWYPKDKPITVAGHPIDNEEEGIGYVISSNSKGPEKVQVNEEYADSNPVMLIMPTKPEEPGLGGGSTGGGTNDNNTDPIFGEFGSGPNEINTVYIGYVKLYDYCGGIFEGPINLHICRTEPYINLTTNQVEIRRPVEISISLPRIYVKAARKGWTKHYNAGWYKVNTVFDTDWSENEDRVGIYVYDYDWDASVKKVSIGVTYKGVGLNISLERDFEYKGDFLGKNDEWWRNWFFITQNNPTPSDEVYKGVIIRSLGSLTFTTPTYTLHY